MAELKWYGIFVFLFGTILSIADPITDFLTVVEFYRTDHKTWFGVGLTFIILPSLFFLIFNCFHEFTREDEQSEQEEYQCTAWKFTHASFLGCNPLYPAWLKLRLLFFYLKMLLKRRQRSNSDQTSKDFEEVLGWSKYAVLTEAVLESAPQFIIQLYAMAVQQQSVTIVQMVSLPVSFLSLAWASSVADTVFHSYEGTLNFSVKDRVLHFVTHLFILSSRLLAVALFTVSYKWWVTSVLIFHCALKVICDIVWLRRKRRLLTFENLLTSVLFSCVHWLRDDVSVTVNDEKIEHNRIVEYVRRMQLVSNVLFVIENITLILLFYFSHFPHTWYSLPVTICVCLFAVLGAVMRLTHFNVEVMAELKWYGIFVFLFGTILSIADPITDFLTVVEFYRTDHKTWFGVGLTFIILPSLFFLIFNCFHEFTREDEQSEQEEYQQRSNSDQTSKDFEEVLGWSKYAVLTEAVLESAPQFIIQLYAMAVQQQSVTIVQMVSLPVSFLSLAWASSVADTVFHSYEGTLNFSVKDRVLHFVTHLFILSSRLLAVALFTVSYKWWVTIISLTPGTPYQSPSASVYLLFLEP
ncbi:unnamed protein product [Porites evermanni]|uniref:XK-related protein n=1 Tax=Porites evermanni TaxID=104178 RepID=A0ABN8QRE3_9CNID|nr:unnamed protein product [Porites evermanni]